MSLAESYPPPPTAKPVNPRLMILALCLLVATAVGLQLGNFPHQYEVRDVDEAGYLQGGLQLLEGLTPGYKVTPAGPLTWMGWLWGASLSAKYLVAPTAEESGKPLVLRPYIAVNHALFDTYRDLSHLRYFVLTMLLIVSVAGVVGGFVLGIRQAGLAGGVLVGGLMAALPLFVELAGTARPYAFGWSFGMLALYAAAVLEVKRSWFWTALFLGLAVGSRLESLMLLPLVWWIFGGRMGLGPSLAALARTGAVALGVALVVAPWLVTSLVDNLRTVLMVRFTSRATVSTWPQMFWSQGLGPVILLWLAGLFRIPRGERLRYFLLAGYVALLLVSMFKGGTPFLRHQTPVIVIVLTATGYGLRFLCRQSVRVEAIVVAGCLLLPLVQTVRLIADNRSSYVPDGSTEWIERHIPAGTRLYLPVNSALRDPLPTAEAADYVWNEVRSLDAWKLKLQYGLQKFGLTGDDAVRAFSEGGMIPERGNRRGWFILGGRPHLSAPRYDVRFVRGMTLFGVRDIATELAKTGGVVLWRDEGPCPGLATPAAQWINSQGHGAYVYVSPDVKAKLREP